MNKRCWHRWDVRKELRREGSMWVYKLIIGTTKTCRKCGEIRVKDRVTR